MANFLDKDGVVYLWGKIKEKFVAKESGKGLSTNDYTTTEKNKLAGIATNANNYNLPTASPNVLGGVKVGTNLSISSGVLSAKDTTYGVMKGATASADGASGLVPAPKQSSGIQYLTNKGEWASIIFPTYPTATPSLDGLMSRNDKAKLNGIENGANKTIVDDTLSDTSTNPVQNKIVKTKIDIVENLANQANIQAGEVASAIKYGSLPADVGFIYKDTGGTSYGLFNDLTSFVDLSPYAKKADIVGTYKYKGSVDTASVLPTSGQTTGDVYNIVASSSYGSAGCNVAWNGEAWDSLGGIFTITSITNRELDTICV
jgi:hypothetical protein|nr:MAG TPA: Head fiber protein [Caudoviricetes sp.]